MVLVKDWISGFLDHHRARFGPNDWPDPACEEWVEFVRGWITALKLKDVNQAEAEAASLRLVTNPPRWRADHIPMVLAAVESSRQERGVAGIGTREASRLASKGCEYCGGEGLATAWYRQPDPTNRILPTVSAHCVCPHGRWIKRRHAEKDPDLLARIPDYADALEGRGRWLTVDPGASQTVVAAIAAPAKTATSDESITFALQFLMGMLSAKPTPLQMILAGAKEFRISHRAIFEAADKLEVVKGNQDGQEVWDLIQRRDQ